MREFFQGWRRKVGCVVLVVACVLASAWIRSVYVADLVTVQLGSFRALVLSGNHQAGIFILRDTPVDVFIRHRRDLLAGVHEIWEFDRTRSFDSRLLAFQSLNADLLYVTYGVDSSTSQTTVPLILYWPIVIPLTLLSAYLILWPQRRTVGNGPRSRRDS